MSEKKRTIILLILLIAGLGLLWLLNRQTDVNFVNQL